MVPDGAKPTQTQAPRLACIERLNLLEIEDLSGVVRDDAVTCESGGAGIRTPDTRIMIPLL